MAFNIKQYLAGGEASLKVKSTPDGSNGEVTHHNIDNFGTAGDAAPTLATNATGLIGWLRKLVDILIGGLTVSGSVSVSNLPATQPVSAAALPLPSGAATETTLAQVRDAIKAQIALASSVWTDNSGAYYVRRESVSEGTGVISVSFVDSAGSAATPGAGLKPLASADKDVIEAFYDATASGTGYSTGDLLARIAIIDTMPSTPTAVYIWMNLTTGAIIAAPSAGNIQRADESITVLGPLTDTQLRASSVGVAPQMASGGNISAQTANPGTTYTALGSQACKQVTIVNDTGTTILVQQGGAGVGVPIFDQSAFTFFGLSNANALGVKRKDDGNTQVTVAARWEA